MTQTIFFRDKSITFSGSNGGDYDLVIDSSVDTIADISRAKVMDFFEKYNSILFLCDTPDDAYEQFCREFRSIKAAGGAVQNSAGQTLMIFRNGRWDLPKGHLERGETIEECAMREVGEETGIRELKIEKKIIETQHAYVLNEEWAIKTTYWYAMKSEDVNTTPQQQEGIEIAAWCSPGEVAQNLENTYPTIRAVMAGL